MTRVRVFLKAMFGFISLLFLSRPSSTHVAYSKDFRDESLHCKFKVKGMA